MLIYFIVILVPFMNNGLFNRRDLDVYWQRVIQIDKVVEFHKHHCSEVLKAFLTVEEEIIRYKNAAKVRFSYVCLHVYVCIQ